MSPLIRVVMVALFTFSLAACSAGTKSLFAVIPATDGKIGTILVYPVQGVGTTVVLNQPYAAAEIDDAGRTTPLTLGRDEVQRLFGTAMAAMPPRPSRFTLYFRENSDQLTSESIASVNSIKADIAGRPAAEVSVIGHTDTVGDEMANDKLSFQRASRVKEELVRQGMSADQIDVSGRGKRELLIPTGDNVNEPRNRRVEINVR